MKPSLPTILAAALALVATHALATDTAPTSRDGKSDHPHRFMKADTNKDGSISKEEWRVKGDTMFVKTDANHDGKLSSEEMKARREARRSEREARREAWKAERDNREHRREAEKPVAH